jgi:hypothetical protein
MWMIINTVVLHGEISYLPYALYVMAIEAAVFFALLRYCNLASAIFAAFMFIFALPYVVLGEYFSYADIPFILPDVAYIAVILALTQFYSKSKSASDVEQW